MSLDKEIRQRQKTLIHLELASVHIERVFYDCRDKSVFTSEVKENIERARMLIEESIDLIENDY